MNHGEQEFGINIYLCHYKGIAIYVNNLLGTFSESGEPLQYLRLCDLKEAIDLRAYNVRR